MISHISLHFAFGCTSNCWRFEIISLKTFDKKSLSHKLKLDTKNQSCLQVERAVFFWWYAVGVNQLPSRMLVILVRERRDMHSFPTAWQTCREMHWWSCLEKFPFQSRCVRKTVNVDDELNLLIITTRQTRLELSLYHSDPLVVW